jgi:hypothetical protein
MRNAIITTMWLALVPAALLAVLPPLGCSKTAEDCASLGKKDGCAATTTGSGGAGGATSSSSSSSGSGGSGGAGGATSSSSGGGGAPPVCESRRAGDALDQTILDLANDQGGHVLAGGNFAGVLAFGPTQLSATGTEAFLALLDAGHLVETWAIKVPVTYLGSGFDAHQDVILAASYTSVAAGDGGLVGPDIGCGALDGNKNFVLAKFAGATHACVWSKSFSAPIERARLTAATNGDIILAGSVMPSGAGSTELGGLVLPSYGGTDILVARFDTAGKSLWSRAYGSEGDDRLAGVVLEPSPSEVVVLAGDFKGTLDFQIGGNALDSKTHRDVFVATLSATGAPSSATSFPGGGDEAAVGLSLASGGGFTVAGDYVASIDVAGTALTSTTANALFLAHFDGNNKVAWASSFDGLGAGAFETMTVASGGFTLAGSELVDAANGQLRLLRVDNLGTEVWREVFPGTGLTRGTALFDDGAAVDVAANFTRTIDLGGKGMLVANGTGATADVLLLRVCK